MPDKRNAPEQEGSAGQGGRTEPDPNSLEGLANRFNQLQDVVQDLDVRNRNLQAWATRTSQENKRLRDKLDNAGGRRRRASGYDDPEDNDLDEPSDRSRPQALSRLEQRLLDEKRRRIQSDSRRGFSDYRMMNPDWKEHHKDVMQVVNDEGQIGEFAVFTGETDEETGLPVLDVQKTYTNVLRSVKLTKFEAAKAAAAAAPAGDENKDKGKETGRATISGSDTAGGEGGGDAITITEDMTSDEMIEKGLVKFKGQTPEKLGIK